MLTRLQVDAKSQVEGSNLLEVFKLECKAAGLPDKDVSSQIFFAHLLKIFPNVVKERKTNRHETKTFYTGIKIKPPHLDQCTGFSSFSDLKAHVPNDFVLEKENEGTVICKHFTGSMANKNPVNKVVHFFINGTWKLEICDKEISLDEVYVSNRYEFSRESLDIVFETVRILRMCSGVTVSKSIIMTRFHQYEQVINETGAKRRLVRSILCDQIISMGKYTDTCRKCQKMTLKHPEKENLQPSISTFEKEPVTKSPMKEPANKSITIDDIRALIPNINDEMAELFLNQAKNFTRDPRGRRWTQNVITVCLKWYCRSPQAYEAFRASKMLLLPCPSTLILYKNKVKQDTGFDQQILEWMHTEAVGKQIHEDGWMGGIVIDEMSIQSDLQIAKNGDVVELCGFTDVGEEGNDCTILRTGKQQRSLGTYVLQFVFLGLTGFRFPFAHFITNGAQGTELHSLFWRAVDELWMFGFKVLYVSLDGAQSNRNFMNYNLSSEIKHSFKTENPYTSSEVAFIMDVSHVVKKIRNNILSSGTAKFHTRLLTLPSTETVQWHMFCDCVKWDKGNSFQLHRKLSNEHINLTSHSKMRNHLAEEVLNSEMLHLMTQYQVYLGTKGKCLNGCIDLLKITSKLIDTFRDMRPIMHMGDERLEDLKQISAWFDKWKCNSKDNAKACMSYQCHEDIQSCTLGFIELCDMVIHKSKHVFVTPALVNSDVVENIFNQQRSTYNGANSNPNALQYRRSLNSIIIGQNIVSTKANAGKGRDAAMPYDFSLKNYPAKRQKLLRY